MKAVKMFAAAALCLGIAIAPARAQAIGAPTVGKRVRDRSLATKGHWLVRQRRELLARIL